MDFRHWLMLGLIAVGAYWLGSRKPGLLGKATMGVVNA